MIEEALIDYENYHKKPNKDKGSLLDYKAMLKFCLHVIPEETKPISHFKNKAEIVAKLKEINLEPHTTIDSLASGLAPRFPCFIRNEYFDKQIYYF